MTYATVPPSHVEATNVGKFLVLERATTPANVLKEKGYVLETLAPHQVRAGHYLASPFDTNKIRKVLRVAASQDEVDDHHRFILLPPPESVFVNVNQSPLLFYVKK